MKTKLLHLLRGKPMPLVPAKTTIPCYSSQANTSSFCGWKALLCQIWFVILFVGFLLFHSFSKPIENWNSATIAILKICYLAKKCEWNNIINHLWKTEVISYRNQKNCRNSAFLCKDETSLPWTEFKGFSFFPFFNTEVVLDVKWFSKDLILSKKNILNYLYSVLFEVSTIIVIIELLAWLWGPVLQLLNFYFFFENPASEKRVVLGKQFWKKHKKLKDSRLFHEQARIQLCVTDHTQLNP